MGQCPRCKAWNSFAEQAEEQKTGGKAKVLEPLQMTGRRQSQKKTPTGFGECDRVLGGGFLSDSFTLLVGDPGIGKSTLALQIALQWAKRDPKKEVFVVSGEESTPQLMGRAERIDICPKNLLLMNAFAIEDIIATIEKYRPSFVVLDSVQTFYSRDYPNPPASLPQIRAVTEQLMHTAKVKSIPILLIGQVTKGGEMAGPQMLAHLVDTVLLFEGDEKHHFRLLRASKNRFGPTSEVGIFEMGERGLQEVKNPSAAFLEGRPKEATGSVLFPFIEGQRAFLVELQALSINSPFGLPKRSSSGFPLQRLALLLAILEKHANIAFASYDVFANVVGGLQVSDPAADLALALALVSSRKQIALPSTIAVFGELGLSGEVRSVAHIDQRIKEAEKMGMQTIILPKTKTKPKSKAKCIVVRSLSEAIAAVQKAF